MRFIRSISKLFILLRGVSFEELINPDSEEENAIEEDSPNQVSDETEATEDNTDLEA